MHTPTTWMLSTSLALALVACGGDGDAPPAPVSVAAAQRHLLADGGSWTLTGPAANGSRYTMAVTFAPLAPGATIAAGAPLPRSQQTFAVVDADGSVSSGGPIYSYDATTLALAQADNGDGTCSLATTNTALPASAAVGATGGVVVMSDLDGCTGQSGVTGTTTTTWSLERDTNVTLLCSNATSKDPQGTTLSSMSICVQTASDGTLGSKARVTITALGVSTTARNF